ncbi:MAG TPA: hypothetical protein VMG32_08195 [Anaeromyxobacteraceae bacterium]|nr:hypothetical protein [Anaeromyxobacteraceae bacterium]
MRARWSSFGVGLWLLLAPLVLSYRAPGAVLHDVTLGLVVCVGTLASLEWPLARLLLALPALWLMAASEEIAWGGTVASNELACGVTVLLLSLLPSSKAAGERSPVKMPA